MAGSCFYTMITFKNIKVHFPGRILFDNLNWQIVPDSRIGLVGDNGEGKTTLFKIIMGNHEPDEGSVILPAGKKIGYLPQDLMTLSDYLLKDYLREITGIVKLERKIKEDQERLSETDTKTNDFKKIARHYEYALHQFEMMGGYRFEARAKGILQGLGFEEQDWLKPCSFFSGGWKMRIVLAGLLVSSPDILLLDEPTNHMDTESLEWLENWLRNYTRTLVVISHDRYFLDKIVREIVELAGQKITFYKGNYSFYLKEKAKQEEIQEKNQKHLQDKKAHLEKFIQRFRYKATKASQVQSRVKMLEKIGPMKEQTSSNNVYFRFASAPRSGEEVVVLKNITHGYGTKEVFHNINVAIHRGERVSLVGVNGAGKSTLSRILSGIESPDKGIVNWGLRVKIAFFSQESAQNLNYQHSVWEEIDRNGNKLTDQEKRNLLGSFLFTGDDIHKSVHQLSGGEKSRLALAKLLLEDSNFLILDEPGNHLDIKTKNIFHQALKQYQGTILIVSHDRFFLDQLVNRVIEIRRGKIYSYPGNYSYFIQKRQMILEKEKIETIAANRSHKVLQPRFIEKQKKRIQAEKRNQQYQLARKIEKELHPLEEKIDRLDKEKIEIEEQLCRKDILQNSEKVQTLKVNLHQINLKLDHLITQWEELIEKKERIRYISPKE